MPELFVHAPADELPGQQGCWVPVGWELPSFPTCRSALRVLRRGKGTLFIHECIGAGGFIGWHVLPTLATWVLK